MAKDTDRNTEDLVSIIIVNYDTSREIAQLLISLEKSSYKNLEIIVVDNNSKDKHLKDLLRDFPQIIFIQSTTNLGFAGGNNLGIDQAKGKFIFFLNPDTEVTANAIMELVQVLKKNPKVGLVSPKIKYHHQPETIQYAGCKLMHPITLQAKPIGRNQLDNGNFDKAMDTAYGHGAAMMTRRDVIDKVGKMNSQYFLYYEELDWSQRIRKAAYKIQYIPSSVIWHKESVSTGKQSPLKTYYLTRNRILFARLHHFGWKRYASWIYILGVSTPKHLSANIIKPKQLKAYLKGLFWHLKNRKLSRQE
ncbi:MAG: glycosyltransferase family 2 protein [Saprospiraceae bacterium]|nr:glycosyltransferase family 2 protein [Saprospiraceae bacterium]